MTTTNPFSSLARRAFLLVIGPVAAFMIFAVMFSLGGNDYHYVDSGDPVRVVTLR